MKTLQLKNIQEDYGTQNTLNYDLLDVQTELEKADNVSHSWGKNLSLSLVDTIIYCAKKDNFIVPSVGLWARIYIKCLKNHNNPNAKKIITHLSNYWLRTMTLISFPTKDRKGYIVHYPSLENNDLARKSDALRGKIVIDLANNDFPPLGQCVFYKDYPNFFDKLFGMGASNELSEIVKEQLGYYPSLWLAPKVCMETSPERMFVFGGFKQYGQGLWLTVNSSDKAIVGTRPFIGIYKK